MDFSRAPSIPTTSARALLLAWAGLGAACFSDDVAVVTDAGATASEATTDGGLSASSTSGGPTSTASDGSSSGESDASTNATNTATTTNTTTDETGGMTTGDASTTGDATSSGEGGCDPDDLPPAFTLDLPLADLVFTPGGHRMVAVTHPPAPESAEIVLLDRCGEVLSTLVSGEPGLGQVGLDGDIAHLYYNHGLEDAVAGIRRLDFPRGVTPTPILEGQRVRDFAVDAAEATLVFVGKEELFRLDLADPGPPTPLGIAVSEAWVDLALAADGHALAWVDLLTQEVRVWDFEDFASTLVTTLPGLKTAKVQWLDDDTIAYVHTDGRTLSIETFAVATSEFGLLYTSPGELLNGFQVSPAGDRLVLLWPDVTEIRALP